MIDYLLLIVFLAYAFVGLRKTTVACMGYVWISLFDPANYSYSFLHGKPLSLLMAMICIISSLINFHKLSRPRSLSISITLLLFATWITITTFYIALFPDPACQKWDWAFKTIMFSLLLHFVLSKKCHLELFMFTFLASLSFFTISAGLKALLGGGGYGTILFVSAKNYGMGETSTFSGLVVASVPLLLFLSRNNAIIPCPRLTRCLLLGMIPISVFAVIATAARTGLIASVTLIALYIFRVKHKLLYFVLVTLLVLSIILIAPESWQNRMSTISEYQTEGSALGRTTVWHWTIDFANKHPMGGGFDAYLANRGQLTKYISQNSSSFSLTTSKAFHSIYFEVLGEHGYIGLSLFLAILGFGFTHLFSLIRNLYSRSLTNTWFYDAAWSLLIMLSVFCVTGLFVGVAFGPFLYYFLAMIITLYKLAWKEMKDISK